MFWRNISRESSIRKTITQIAKQSTRFQLPGYNLPLNWKPVTKYDQPLFPNALEFEYIDEERIGHIKTAREFTMMRVMNAVMEKVGWDTKIYNEKIITKWTTEIRENGKDVSPKMMDWIWDELKYKAKIMKETGMVTAYNPGIVRSDTAISKELQEALQKAVQKLEQVPEKDYHPGSNDTVVDLVHPSLFPVVYGRICVLPDELLHRDHWWAWSGKAEVLATPSELETTKKVYHGSLRHSQFKLYSTKFQWLPCDVDFVGNGESRIFSYINNLHPQKHQDLYRIIERIIDEAIPLWDESLHEAQSRPADRIEYRHVEYFTAEPEPERSEDDHDEIEFFSRHDEWEDRRRVRQPESEGKFKPLDRQGYREPHSVRLREQFRESGLQIIVKLANIELTPERPRY